MGTLMHRRWLAWHRRADCDQVIQSTPRRPEVFDVIELFYSLEGAAPEIDDDVTVGAADVTDQDNIVTKDQMESIKKAEDKIFESLAYRKMCNQVRGWRKKGMGSD